MVRRKVETFEPVTKVNQNESWLRRGGWRHRSIPRIRREAMIRKSGLAAAGFGIRAGITRCSSSESWEP
jgi:hypothetical protein